MSKRVVIEENTPLKLEERYLKICEELLKENPKQLFRLNNGSLIFDEYIVGALQIDDLTVEIKSRHDIFSLEKIFEMIFFLKTKGYERRMDVLGYKKDSSFGMSQIASSFCKMCEKLIQFGLSGHFNKINKKSKYLRGKIEFRKFNKKVMVLEGLEVNYQYYSLNSFENMLIKAALRKLSASQNNPTLQVKINSLLREFDFIDIYTPTKTELREYKYNSQFSNPHYSMMTEYAIIILDNLNLSFKGGCLTGSSFLINSNMLFENYIFKILSENLEEQIEKWKTPKNYGTITYQEHEGQKGFLPDILVDYAPKKSSCRAVFDVKNKYFKPDLRKLSDAVKSPDIYQIIFYCNQLKTNCGGLILPSNESFKPLKLAIEDKNDLTLFIVSINMNKPIHERNTELLDNLKNDVFINT